MKRYNAYKDSGVKWIGEIPSHWKTTKLKHIIVKLYREKRPNSELLVCSNKGKVIKKVILKLVLSLTMMIFTKVSAKAIC